MNYTACLELDIEHPLVEPRRWSLLPGRAAERFLAARRLRWRFGPAEGKGLPGASGLPFENAARLRFIAEEGWRGGAGLERLLADIGRLDFFLFCNEPYFSRVTDSPVFRPGKELLHFDFSALPGRNGPAELQQTGARKNVKQGAAGRAKQGSQHSLPGNTGPGEGREDFTAILEAARAELIAFDEAMQAEVAQTRKKYQGSPFGLPPLALLSLPPLPPSGGPAVAFRLVFAPRKLRWAYEISPRPGGTGKPDQPEQILRIDGAPCAFAEAPEAGTGNDSPAGASLVLLSASAISLAPVPLPRLRLMLESPDAPGGSGAAATPRSPADFANPETPAAPAGQADLAAALASTDMPDSENSGSSGVFSSAAGRAFPLLENLPLPGPAQIVWDKGLNDYKAVVRIDLSRFGLSF